jgi:hypothetical protein
MQPRPDNEPVTQEQLDQLSGMITPHIKTLLGLGSERDLSIRISLSAIPMIPSSGHMLVFSLLLDGKDLPFDQEQKVTEFLSSAFGVEAFKVRSAKA